jgi:hypothetical protein
MLAAISALQAEEDDSFVVNQARVQDLGLLSIVYGAANADEQQVGCSARSDTTPRR